MMESSFVSSSEALNCLSDECEMQILVKQEIKEIEVDHHWVTSMSTDNLICDTCGAECKNEAGLRLHKRKYHGEHADNRPKSVACEICGLMYTSRNNMLQHVRRMHEGLKKKEYICAMCESVFRTRKNIKSHLKSHEYRDVNDFATLLKYLPEGYSYRISNFKSRGNDNFSVTLEFYLNDTEQGLAWVTQFQNRNYVTFRKCQMRPSIRPDLFKVKYRCHHKTLSRNTAASRKNTNCPAVLFLYVKPRMKNNSNAVVCTTVSLEAKIKLIHIHNHDVNVESLRYRTPSTEVEKEFVSLFKAGYKPMNALRMYLQKLKLEYEDNFLVVSKNRSICPDPQWVYYLYRKFNKNS